MVLVKDLKVVPIKAVKVVRVEIKVEVKVKVNGGHIEMIVIYADRILKIGLHDSVLKFTDFASLVYLDFWKYPKIIAELESGDY